MGARQVAEMLPCVSEACESVEGVEGPSAFCTLEATNAAGARVWVQVMPGNVNMSYPFADEPLALLRARGVRVPEDAYPIDWAAGEYATFGFAEIAPGEHASLVDQIFVKVLACDAAAYEVESTVEPL